MTNGSSKSSASLPERDHLNKVPATAKFSVPVWGKTIAFEVGCVQNKKVFINLLGEHCQVDPAALAAAQHPWAAVLTCADSRIPLEWIFCVGAGELFAVRSAGNTAFDAGIASLEYAVEQLGVPMILVMGHSGCGAVSAAMSDQPLTPLQEQLVEPIRACLQSGDDLSRAVRRNACQSAQQLTVRSALLHEAQASGRLRIVSGCFDIATGRMELI